MEGNTVQKYQEMLNVRTTSIILSIAQTSSSSSFIKFKWSPWIRGRPVDAQWMPNECPMDAAECSPGVHVNFAFYTCRFCSFNQPFTEKMSAVKRILLIWIAKVLIAYTRRYAVQYGDYMQSLLDTSPACVVPANSLMKFRNIFFDLKSGSHWASQQESEISLIVQYVERSEMSREWRKAFDCQTPPRSMVQPIWSQRMVPTTYGHRIARNIRRSDQSRASHRRNCAESRKQLQHTSRT